MKTLLTIPLWTLLANAAAAQISPAAPGAQITDLTRPAFYRIHVCEVTRAGVGTDGNYVALTCPSGPFTDETHKLEAAKQDQMLAVALAALTSGRQVQVSVRPVTGGVDELASIFALD